MTSRIPAIVVGGGVSGLVCAHALRNAGVEALVVEASGRAGGVIRSERRDGFLLELGPQSFSGTAGLRRLCAELGIEDQLVEAPALAPRHVLVNGELVAVPMSPPALLTSSLLGWGTKWNIARDAFGRSQAPDEDESIAGFVRRKFGAEVLDRLVGPFVSGVYAGDPERLSLRSAFPQLNEAEKAAGSVLGGIEHAPVAVVSLGYRRVDVGHSLEGFGFLVPRSSGLRVLGTVWNSSLFSGRAPDGFALLTSFVGGATDPAAVTLSSDSLATLVHAEIQPLLRLSGAPAFSNVQIYRRALPQYNLGHGARLAAIEKLRLAVGNLFLAGNYLRGPAIGSCVEQGLGIAGEIAGTATGAAHLL